MSRRRLSGEAERVNPVVPMHVWRSPESAGVEIVIATHMGVYAIVHDHCVAALPAETGGFLLGTVGFDAWLNCWHLEIDTAVALEPLDQNATHFSFTWRDVDQVRTYREEQGKALVGWFHSHPDLGIFLSDTDLDKTHRVLFAEPFQVALVYDPVRMRAGYFYWDGPQTIDPGQRGWREFQIAIEGEITAERTADDRDRPAAPAGADRAPASPEPDARRATPAPEAEPAETTEELPRPLPPGPTEGVRRSDAGVREPEIREGLPPATVVLALLLAVLLVVLGTVIGKLF